MNSHLLEQLFKTERSNLRINLTNNWNSKYMKTGNGCQMVNEEQVQDQEKDVKQKILDNGKSYLPEKGLKAQASGKFVTKQALH